MEMNRICDVLSFSKREFLLGAGCSGGHTSCTLSLAIKLNQVPPDNYLWNAEYEKPM
jgi:hypothetical protein